MVLDVLMILSSYPASIDEAVFIAFVRSAKQVPI